MKTHLIEGKEYSHPEIHYVGEFADTPNYGDWFVIVEEGHKYEGLVFGVSNIKLINGVEVEYDIMLAEDDVNINDVSEMIDNFVNIMISISGDNDEDQDSI